MLIDVFEPQLIEDLLSQSLSVNRIPLNSHGYADYLWHGIDNHIIQVERKQIDEILGGMDRIEEQLRKEMQKAEENILLWEGTFEPIAGTKSACHSFRKAKDGRIMIPGHKYHTSYAGVQAWFYQLDKAGWTIVNTIDQVATSVTLVALYNSSQKAEHTTLLRYIKQKIYPPTPNPYVETLMGIKGASIGGEIAQALIERYGTPWYTFQQSAEDLAQTLVGDKQLGLVRTKKLLKSIGRQT